jgi:antitoxin (DNA-binding transcriptional repressor) of toxin-antitoxin stability system
MNICAKLPLFNMRTVGLSEARRKLSKLVDQTSKGERIGLSRNGKLVALIVQPQSEINLENIFKEIESIRRRSKLPKGTSVRSLIDEGRA